MGKKEYKNKIEKLSISLTEWMGTPVSIFLHSLIFLFTFLLIFVGFNAERVMLVLTTAVSLEAIYLSLFIQMTVNRNTESLEDVEEDIDEIEEDTTPLEDSLTKIEKKIAELQKDISLLHKNK